MSEVHGPHMRRAAIASLAVSALLVCLKSYAYLATGSVAVLASLADSALDLFTSGLNMLAIHEALTPADSEHRFGHGKAEPLAGLAQGAFIAASAIFVLIEAVQRLLSPQPIENGLIAMVVMGISILAAICLILFQRHVARRTGSVAVDADAVHYFGDLVGNAGVVLAILLVTKLGWNNADPLIALAVAAVLTFSSFKVLRVSLDQLMDRELPEADRARIIAVIRRHPGVLALHDLKTRQAGLRVFIQVHLELDPNMPLSAAHQISDAVERDLCAAFEDAEVLIHQDPLGYDDALSASDRIVAV